MYDVVVIGQGLSGMLAAIWTKEQGYNTALVASGTGKILQSTGVIDLIPGKDGTLKDWMELFELRTLTKSQIQLAIDKFKMLTKRLDYPYKGYFESPAPIITGSGHIKMTALYPYTIKPVPSEGHVVIVGFKEITDFQPAFIKGILQQERPALTIDTISIQLGKQAQRTMTQLDAARLLDQKEMRNHCIQQMKKQLAEQGIHQADLFVFPASLGVSQWKETIDAFSAELGGNVTEAPGMPPNATAIRLHEALKKEATKMGIRFYADTTVVGCHLSGEKVQSLKIRASNQQISELAGRHFILATGGILGGGLEITSQGIKETALGIPVNEYGELVHYPNNLFTLGGSNGTRFTQFGITGGMYSIINSYETTCKLQQTVLGGVGSA